MPTPQSAYDGQRLEQGYISRNANRGALPRRYYDRVDAHSFNREVAQQGIGRYSADRSIEYGQACR